VLIHQVGSIILAGSNPVLTTMSKRYSTDLPMSHLNLVGYWTGHPQTPVSWEQRDGTNPPSSVAVLMGDAPQVFKK